MTKPKRIRSEAQKEADRRYRAKRKTPRVSVEFTPEELEQIDANRGEQTRHAFIRNRALDLST